MPRQACPSAPPADDLLDSSLSWRLARANQDDVRASRELSVEPGPPRNCAPATGAGPRRGGDRYLLAKPINRKQDAWRTLPAALHSMPVDVSDVPAPRI